MHHGYGQAPREQPDLQSNLTSREAPIITDGVRSCCAVTHRKVYIAHVEKTIVHDVIVVLSSALKTTSVHEGVFKRDGCTLVSPVVVHFIGDVFGLRGLQIGRRLGVQAGYKETQPSLEASFRFHGDVCRPPTITVPCSSNVDGMPRRHALLAFVAMAVMRDVADLAALFYKVLLMPAQTHPDRLRLNGTAFNTTTDILRALQDRLF